MTGTGAPQRAVAHLAAALLSLRPLVEVLDPPVRVSGVEGGTEGVQVVLDRLSERLGTPRIEVTPPAGDGEVGLFERIVRDRLDLAGVAAAAAPGAWPEAIDRIADAAVGAAFEGLCTRTEVLGPGPGAAAIKVYAAGDRRYPAVVIAPPCGMVARLWERWVRALSKQFLVLTWESRWLFGPAAARPCAGGSGRGWDVQAQVADLFAVMDHYEVPNAHVLGLCGGAVLALAAAARQPDRVGSLSLWHGDYEFGPGHPKTEHQHNLKALMAMAAEGREQAAAIHDVLLDAVLDTVPADLAHLVLYPYATPELFYRYCILNGSIMDTAAQPLLERVTQPVLVVTSEDDHTAHPAGSERVAATLPGALLHIAAHGDHISLFRGAEELMTLAVAFISEHACVARAQS